MKEIILLKYGEIALKGLNKSTFESIMIKNIKYRLKKSESFPLQKHSQQYTLNLMRKFQTFPKLLTCLKKYSA